MIKNRISCVCLLFLASILPAWNVVASEYAQRDAVFTLNLQAVDLRDALQVLADELALNLVMSANVTGTVSIHIEALSIEQAIDVLLFDTGLGFRLNDNLLVVASPDVLARFDEQQRARWQERDSMQTAWIALSYADGRQLAELLMSANAGDSRDGGVNQNADSATAGLLSSRGTAHVDLRTNTLIVRDTASHLSSVKALIEQLDVAVGQVLIEARIVSASLDTGRELGMRWGFELDSAAAATRNSQALTLGGDHRAATVAQAVFLRSQQMLDLELSALERAGEAELIARPRVTTQDNTPAVIQSGVRIPYQAQAGGTAGGSITQFVDAVLALEVTPLITPDGRIVMQLDIRQDAVAAGSADVPAINTNTIRTRVLVRDGETLVLGGIFREEQTRAEAATPLLRRLPLFGALFRREHTTAHRTELLIFITPQIVQESPADGV